MKKILDKPYKTIICTLTVLLLTPITLKGDVNLFKTSNISEPTIKTDNRIVLTAELTPTNNVIVIKDSTEEVIPKSQEKKSSSLSRGGNIPFKEINERETINGYVREITAKYNVDPELIMSIIQQESEYNPKAKNGNCLGLMQVSAYWHKDRAKRLNATDLFNPYNNILVGVDYISELLTQYKDPRLVLMLYNMEHETALRLYRNGQISTYAKTIIAREEQYKKGE